MPDFIQLEGFEENGKRMDLYLRRTDISVIKKNHLVLSKDDFVIEKTLYNDRIDPESKMFDLGYITMNSGQTYELRLLLDSDIEHSNKLLEAYWSNIFQNSGN